MNLDAWTQAFTDALSNFWTKIAAFLPNFIATFAIVLIGLYLTRVMSGWLGKVLGKIGMDRLCDKIGVTAALKTMGFSKTPSEALSVLVRLFLTLLIVLTAAETLGLDRVSSVVDQFVLYLPKMFGAIVVVIGGMFVGHHLRKSVGRAMKHLGVDYGKAVAQIVYGIVLIITFSLAVGQLEIQTQMFDLFFGIVIATVGLAAALSLGLGAREISSHLVAGVYLREQLLPGDQINASGSQGMIIAVGSVNTIIERDDASQIRIPNAVLLQSVFVTRSSLLNSSEDLSNE